MSAYFFHNAESLIPNNLPKIKELNQNNKTHQMIIKPTSDAEWLLNQNKLQTGSEVITNRYHNILLKNNLAYYNGRSRHTKFINACEDFFSPKLFDLIGCISKKEALFSKLVQFYNKNNGYHPIRHLLLMTFLGLTAEEFFTEFVEFKPFGSPPYPCLNKAANHYQDLRIKGFRVFDNLTKDKRYQLPVAIFECDCGFIYQRLGPDKSEDDKFKFNSVREYGKVWTDKFTNLWADLSISATEIGRRLGTSQTSVGRHAIRLNLPMNTKNTRSLEGYKRHRNPRESFSKTVKDNRKKWLNILKKYNNLTRQELLDKENFIYLWMRRNDSEWFEKNLPKTIRIPRCKPYLDWDKIDKDLSEKILVICKNIKDSPNFPIRISISEFNRQTDNRKRLDDRKLRLPITNKLIEENLEPLEDFMLRKLEWAKNYFIQQSQIPSRQELKAKAVIINSTSNNSQKIQEAINTTLIEIAKEINLQNNRFKKRRD